MPNAPHKITGRDRRRRTSWTVALGDRVARSLITVGGIGTIVAVLLVCVYLFSVVLPLFKPAEIERTESLPESLAAAAPTGAKASSDKNSLGLARIGADEFGLIGWGLFRDGRLRSFRLDNGQVLRDFTAKEIGLDGVSAVSFAVDGQHAVFGFRDGKILLGRIGFNTRFVEPAAVPQAIRELPPGGLAAWDEGMVTRTPTGQFRRQKLVVELEPPIATADTQPIVLVDHVSSASGSVFCSLSANGKLRVSSLETQHDLMTGDDVSTLAGTELPLPPGSGGAPTFLRMAGLGDYAYLAWPDGRLLRYEIRDLEHPRLVEDLNVLSEPGARLTSLEPLLGGTSLVAGDSTGHVRIWFPVAMDQATAAPDHRKLIHAQEFSAGGSAVTAICSASTAREIAVGYGSGRVQLLYITSSKTVLDLKTPEVLPVEAVAISPKGDLLLAATSHAVDTWSFDPEHPDATLASLFLPVWYEGELGPKQIWQTSGDEGFEPKLGLMPLVFGTLKAVFYSMLFGAPLALLAAIYTSEFLSPKGRARIKPVIELMASLPSVVLGFLAALVIAPVVARIVPQVISAIVSLPMALLLGAYVWQLLPRDWTLRLARLRFFVILCGAIPAGLFAAGICGPWLERLLFDGDVKGWLNHQHGSALPGWLFLLLPLGAVATTMVVGTAVNPWLRELSGAWGRTRIAAVELLKFLSGTTLTLILVGIVAWLLSAVGADSRGSLVGKYEQLNALVVGLVMGFAIIPLIYTLADDALSSVPAHLRSASLGAGATPWQTAMRVVVPTAMSGLFSAVMIGLGRAVGETMIVLMAAGGMPVMDMNIFNGFQTLSAAIAAQLPEAAIGSTHYRTLFLAALALFLITFVVNTVAEIVRQRFRRRAYEL
jgi:phosphate transport system permease protein